MDIAQSIDFNRLDNLDNHAVSSPSLSKRALGIGVNKEFDMHTTDPVPYPAEAPPVYQHDQTTDPTLTSNPSDHPKFLLRTITQKSGSSLGSTLRHGRPASQPRRSMQAPEIEPAPSSSHRLQEAFVQDANKEPAFPPETTVLLPRGRDTIPYTLWGNEKRVVIRQPTELRFYKRPNSRSFYRTTETSWVTYSFDSASQASDFQSTLLSPLQLIRSLPTTRTMRLHPSSLIRAFSPRLQLCGLENLRVFRDVNDPHCLVCMIHYSPNFRPSDGEEYIVFRLYPPPRNSVRIREDGNSCVKIKGLDIRGSPAGEQAKKGNGFQSKSELMEEEAYGSQSIEKLKIEFESGKEKREFLEMTRELQGLSSW
ncbi:MAG: hypothetical protein Q9168_007093 [Polycauliona sp. 1 TL-2023]